MLSRTNTWAMDTKYRYSSDPIGPHGSHSFANHRNRHSLLTTSTYLAAYTSSHLSYKCTLKNNHVELPQLVCLLPWDLFLDLSCPAFVQPPRPTASAVDATAPEGTANVRDSPRMATGYWIQIFVPGCADPIRPTRACVLRL